MIAVLETISIGILVFFLVSCVATVTLLAMSVREISWYARGRGPARTRRPELARRPSVSLVTPAYNEEALIVQSAKAFLASDYAPLEVVVVDDGSRDETFAQLDEAFDLVTLPVRGRTVLSTAPIRGVHISRTEPRLRVVHKDNGGRSDAINAGISVARGELVVIVDADSLLEPQAITRAVVPFKVHPDHCMAVGGGIPCGALRPGDQHAVGYRSEHAPNRAFSSTGASPRQIRSTCPGRCLSTAVSQVLRVCVADEEEPASGLIEESAEIHEAVEPGMDVAAEVVRGLARVSVHIAAAHLVRARL